MNVLSAYKKLEEEFKELDHECSRLEQKEYDKEDKYLVRIKELEEEKKTNLEHIDFWHNSYNEAIDNVHRLEEENKEYRRINNIVDKISSKDIEKVMKEFNNNYIPKQIIIDEIEEVANIINTIKQYGYTSRLHELRVKRKVLEELLEERNK